MRKLLFLFAILCSNAAFAQSNEPVRLNLISPLNYQVFQRESQSAGKIVIECVLETKARGTLTNLDRLEAQFVGPSVNGNDSAGWQALPFDNRVRHFRAELRVPAGGWYRVQVRLAAGGNIV